MLLLSSITFGFATLAMKSGERARMLSWLLVTFVLGLGFVGLEIREFHGMVQAGAGPDRSGFLSAFFTLVGTHGLHVSFGLIWILIMASQVMVKGLTAPVTRACCAWACSGISSTSSGSASSPSSTFQGSCEWHAQPPTTITA